MNADRFAQHMAKIERRLAHSPSRTRNAIRRMARHEGAALVIAGGKVVGYRLKNGSVVCRKFRYRDQSHALADLTRIANEATNKHIPVRAYPCPHCRGWHLTSRA